jgi:FkbM family methyltransferase
VRLTGALARRVQRPEILGLIDPVARVILHEEIAGRALVPAFLGQCSTFVDVGTNRGQWLEAAVRCAPAGRHLAFEANPDLCVSIKERFPGVDLRPLALSNTSGYAQFCRFRRLDGFSGLIQRHDVPDSYDFIEVPVARLDDEINELAPSLIKIDVEGAELDVLLGSENVLRTYQPPIIFEHQAAPALLYERTSADVWSFLTDFGYRIFDLPGAGPMLRSDFVAAASSGLSVNWLAVAERSGA